MISMLHIFNKIQLKTGCSASLMMTWRRKQDDILTGEHLGFEKEPTQKALFSSQVKSCVP
jgi:hypothetical protein